MKHSLHPPRLGALSLIVAAFTLAAFPQDNATLQGPILGFVPDSRDASIRPILGIPGASLLGHPLALDSPIRVAAVSPTQTEALAVLGDDHEILASIRFATDSFARVDLSEADPGVDVISFSPTGSAAALYDHQTGMLQSLLLKPEPQVLFKFDASTIRGRMKAMALSDSGKFAVVQFISEAGAQTWVVDSRKHRMLLPVPVSSAFAFLPSKEDFFTADGEAGQLARVTQLESMRSQGLRVLPVLTAAELFGVLNIAVAPDGGRIYGVTVSGYALVLDVTTGEAVTLPCYCSASGMHPLRGLSVFRLSSPEDGPVAVLDAGREIAAARVVLIPSEVIP